MTTTQRTAPAPPARDIAPSPPPAVIPLAARIAALTCTYSFAEGALLDSASPDVAPADGDTSLVDKVKTCLRDLIGCAFECGDSAWGRQAMAMATPADRRLGGATIIGSSQVTSVADAAFVNAVLGHGLVREDMHSASISHLGMVVLPALLALSQKQRVHGRDFVSAAIVGYETGAAIGSALMDAQLARLLRPTGITGPLAAAAAGARLLGLNVSQTVSALALAANTTSGLNQWGHTGGTEMFFHPGFAARNAISAVLLAQAGAFASPSALDGEAGLFRAHGKPAAAVNVRVFEGRPEILSVYHKPVPACNFAQTASQAAIALARSGNCPPNQIDSIIIRVPGAAAAYPGCDFRGRFEHVLQAKMSIQYNVAAALLTGDVTEANFALLEDAALYYLLSITRLEVDAAMTAAYPALQGGEVEVRLAGGGRHKHRLDDVVHATASQVRDRFHAAAVAKLGEPTAARIEALIAGLEHNADAGLLARSLASSSAGSSAASMATATPASDQ